MSYNGPERINCFNEACAGDILMVLHDSTVSNIIGETLTAWYWNLISVSKYHLLVLGISLVWALVVQSSPVL